MSGETQSGDQPAISEAPPPPRALPVQRALEVALLAPALMLPQAAIDPGFLERASRAEPRPPRQESDHTFTALACAWPPSWVLGSAADPSGE